MANSISAAKLKKVVTSEINDPALKKRLSKLGAPHLDTLIRESGVVLEDRIRTVSGLAGFYGVKLVDEAFGAGSKALKFSEHAGEQDGVRLLYRGAIQFIRNPPMHKLVDYSINNAMALIRMIDSLLVLLPPVKPSVLVDQIPDGQQQFLELVEKLSPQAVERMAQLLAKMQSLADVSKGLFDLDFGSVSANLYWLTNDGKRLRFFTLEARKRWVVLRLDYIRKAGYEILATKMEQLNASTIPLRSGNKSGAADILKIDAARIVDLLDGLVSLIRDEAKVV